MGAMEPKPIHRLADEVVNRVAAGEVIHRPASALKEILENSLDAGATSIVVTVKDGGNKLLQVTDNGCGIREADLPILCERHTTSKLSKFEDLSAMSTFGFRGEALASISFVANLTVTTMTRGATHALKASYCDGALDGAGARPCAGNPGTTITVENLFYNVPTRRKALKSPGEEFAKVLDVMQRYAASRTDVAFTCRKHGEARPSLHCAVTPNRIDRMRAIYGSQVARELTPMTLSNSASNSDAPGDDGDAAGDASPPASRFPGAEILCVASTESAVAFLDVARGTFLGTGSSGASGTTHKTQLTPKTPSRALAVAPLTMNGTPPRWMTRGRGADGALRASTTASSLWFNSAIGEDEPARTSTSSTGGKMDRRASWARAAANEATAFVGVASAEAIRVYPAHGAARGERHTVKKASAEEPLVAAALVAPIAPDDDDDDDAGDATRDDDDDGFVSLRPAAFAAVSSRGRLMSWSLPGLAPLRSVGPVPPISVADGAGFCVDGVVFASAGGGAGSVAKLALAPRRGGAKTGAESGLALYDGELAAAAAAAESAATFDTQRHPNAPGGGHPKAPGGHPPASVQSPFSPEGTPEKPAGSSSAKGDLTKSVNHLLKGDRRAALASFGSVMRATKEKANAAMAQAKTRIKEATMGATGGNESDDFSSDDKTAADLAFLFAERELLMEPERSDVVERRAVSTERGAGRGGSGSSSTGAAEDSNRAALFASVGSAAGGSRSVGSSAGGSRSVGSSAARSAGVGSTGDDADRAALFGRSGTGASPSATYPVAPKVNTAADIRAKYGIRKKAAEGRGGGATTQGDDPASLADNLEETRNKLHERGERLRGIQDKTERMQSDAEDFASMAEKLRKQQEKSWW